MNLMFALKGIAVLFIFTVLCRFVLALPLSIVTSEIQSLSHNTSSFVEAGVGPVLVMISNVFTFISILFGISIIVIMGAIAFNGPGTYDTGGYNEKPPRY